MVSQCQAFSAGVSLGGLLLAVILFFNKDMFASTRGSSSSAPTRMLSFAPAALPTHGTKFDGASAATFKLQGAPPMPTHGTKFVGGSAATFKLRGAQHSVEMVTKVRFKVESTPAPNQKVKVKKDAPPKKYEDMSPRERSKEDLRKDGVDLKATYSAEQAVAYMKKYAFARFDETAELHANLNLDPKYNDQQIRTTVSLPHGTGKEVRVAVLADGPAAEAAKAAGADIVGMDTLITDLSEGKLDFDVLIAMPLAMPKLAKLGRILGPKGLMPSPKAGTVSANPEEAVKQFKKGKLEFRNDKQGIIHVPFGKLSFDDAALVDNLLEVFKVITMNRPTGCKGKLWQTASISSSMGTGFKLDVNAMTQRTGN